MNMNEKNRTFCSFSTYRGALMGIAILGVMILHSIKWAGLEDTLFKQIASPFARIAFTDGFIFLSGFGLHYSFRKNSNLKEFFIKRWYRLMVPFLIMATPFYLYGLYVNSDFIRFLLNESTIYFWLYGNNGMWYISVSVVLYILFPLLYKIIFRTEDNRSVTIRALSLIILCICSVVAVSVLSPSYYEMVSIGIEKTPMFIIGILVGYYAVNSYKLTLYHLIGGVFL